MDKTVAGLIGAVTLLAAADPAQAAIPAPANLDAANLQAAMRVDSYADLLKPIPDAVALLKESDEAVAKAELPPADSEHEATVQQAQYYYHHHHHHGFYPPFYRHHHHHHHRYYRRYHHHHHHHHGYYVPYGY